MRATIALQPTQPVHHVTRPGFAIVAQGAKETLAGDRLFEYGRGRLHRHFGRPADLRAHRARQQGQAPTWPAGSRWIRPRSRRCCSETAGSDDGAPAPCGYGVRRAPAELIECATRLLRLLDKPRDVPVLRPLIEREILWRLLAGEQGGRVRQIGLADSRLAQVSHAIRRIRDRYAQALEASRRATRRWRR